MYGSSDQWLWLVVFIQRILWSPTSKETPPTWYTTPLASQLIRQQVGGGVSFDLGLQRMRCIKTTRQSPWSEDPYI